MELELATSDKGNNILSEWKVKLEAGEGGNNNAVMAAPDSNYKLEMKSSNIILVPMPKKNDGFEMMVAEIGLIQLEYCLDLKSELSFIGATEPRLTHTSEIQILNYKQVMASAIWQSGRLNLTRSNADCWRAVFGNL